ncbi:phosphoribosylglycinamide formyltransferase [Metabacillus sp. GX 13764]|uniref:phosphoribosylglycinamide formyltransferase n=1 Tax=Metabacillus kandeliae TaxID=2900151 RepID=UPI001E5D7D04|nr:phosphoribosylglycinamide formyltransferase [Metabacillus kandeliae]MCD7034424.1 phosphoribosylglycinamide formyltransferase [Metabacillus kandeliae]
MKKAAVFASGNGSNFQAIVDAAKSGGLAADISLLVSDREKAYAAERAKAEGIPAFVFHPKQYETKAAFEREILSALKAKGVEWIFLAGYMRLIGPTLLEAYEQRIVNLHPSLLPAFPGKDAVKQAMDAGATETGISVHFVDAGMDTGPIIAQKPISIEKSDTLDSLTEKIHRAEHSFYPYVLQKIIEEKAKVVPK